MVELKLDNEYIMSADSRGKESELYRDHSSQVKRRRMLQFESEVLETPLCNDEDFLRSKVDARTIARKGRTLLLIDTKSALFMYRRHKTLLRLLFLICHNGLLVLQARLVSHSDKHVFLFQLMN